jgi:hypothetical protein
LLRVDSTKLFKIVVLFIVIGSDYHFVQLIVDAEDSGHSGVARERTYIMCWRKLRTTILNDPVELYNAITADVKKCVSTKPSDYYVADSVDIAMEAQSCASTRKIMYQPFCEDLTYLLNGREQECIEILDSEYAARFSKDPGENDDLVYFLGDNAAARKVWSAVSGKLPTFRTNNGKYWMRKRKRWLCPREKLAALGWPVTPDVASAMGVPMVPVRDAKRAESIAGNCMHLSTSTVILFVALSCFGPR